MSDAATSPVNPHYLEHVTNAAEAQGVEVTEDIVNGNGIKLLAKGARVDGAARDKLLQHKLSKPLEQCLQVEGGLAPSQFEAVGEALLKKHPLLRALCAPGRARPAPASLAGLTLSAPLLSLLTLYSQLQDDRLEHTVGVAMMTLSLARRLMPGEIERHRVLATAGLVHDIGELYLDPGYFAKGKRLDGDEWLHIVSHPLIAHHVLTGLEGAGPPVAEPVLLHHERLDGFGYPRRISGDAFTLDGQVLAAAEWLMALAESGLSPVTRAGMASRLIPGEFSRPLLEAVSAAAREAPDTPVELDSATPLAQAVPRIVRLAGTLRRFQEARGWIEGQIAVAPPALRGVLEAGMHRILRIQTSFSSAGLDVPSPELLLAELASLHDPQVYIEVMTLVGEMEWRMRELEREQRVRAKPLAPDENAVIAGLIERLRGPRPGA